MRGCPNSSDHKTTWEGVVLEDDLVDDTRAWFPETDVVLGACGGQKVINFLVDALCPVQILLTTDLSFNQVITVNSRGCGNGWHASGHELKNGHLSSCVLASYSVGS